MSCSGWREVKLGDIVQFNPRESIAKNQIAKKIAMEKLKPYNRTIEDYEYAEFKGGTKFRNGDTLLARITPCLENGKTAQVSILNEDEVGFGSTEYIVLREKPNKSVNNFVYYLSISPRFRDIAIKSMIGTSGRQRVQQDVLENTRIPLPELEEQKAIAATLSCLDDKIEFNNRINKTLEEMAQAIFKSWFVDFEPFQDGEFEDSELGRIPKGWRVGIVSDLGNVIGGSTPSKACSEYYTDEGIAWITPKDLSVNKNKFISKGQIDITELGLKNSSTKIMPKGTVLFSSRAPIGYLAIAKNDVTTNQGFKSVVPYKNTGTAYVYYFLKNNVQIIESRASGSTFKEVSGTMMKQIPALIPDDKILQEFQKSCNLIFKKQMLLESQNQHLSVIRDSLLPKLMSGEIRVPIEGKEVRA
jgi:type I restriction enzyme S subunit